MRVAETLLGPDSFSGWGIRTVASGEARFNPISYHNGSIWPHDNAMIALGFARYGFVVAHDPGLLRNVRSCGLSGVKTRKCMNCPARVNELATQAASIESRRRSCRNEPPVG